MTNPVCAIYEGPSTSGSVESITCSQPLVGRYLQLQRTVADGQQLNLNEVVVSSIGNSSTFRICIRIRIRIL
jgi:hypothetical protein